MTAPTYPTTQHPAGYRLGCDTGGTFTDFVLLDPVSGSLWLEKVLTTPEDPARGVFDGIDRLRRIVPSFPEQTTAVIYGTTLVINALIERKGARTALVTTKGFRDVMELRRTNRGDLWDLSGRLPEPIIPRHDRYEIVERLWADGTVHTLPDHALLEALANDLRRKGIESVAVCLLHSYLNPKHEQVVREVLAAEAPEIYVSLSSDVLPEIKEYERTVATSVNAYVQPVVARYLPQLERGLINRGIGGALRLMMSEGSVTSSETATKFPVRTVESGPVGGVLAAHQLAESLGFKQAIAYDMGGTTAKTALIVDGVLPITWDHEIARVYRFKPGSGLPLSTPTVDILEIGAGGGSIAQVNRMGLLQIGPESAGADPGPACYGRGGVYPTVTDADLLLGYLDPNYFLGGRMPIDKAAAHQAIQEYIAGPLGISTKEAAWRIVNLADETMATAIRLQIAHQGGDPARFSLIAYGGAGPLHAFRIAGKLGVRQIVVPRGAGVMSAYGFVTATMAFRRTQTFQRPLADCHPPELEQAFVALADRALELAGEETLGARRETERWLRMRYAGQGYEIRVPLGNASQHALRFETITAGFNAQYARLYGRAYPDQSLEVVALEVVLLGKRPSIAELQPDGGRGVVGSARKGQRLAYLPETGELAPCDVFDRYVLVPGTKIEGPAIFEEREATLIVGENALVTVGAAGHLIVER